MTRPLDTVILGAALLVLGFAAAEFAAQGVARAVQQEPWACSTDSECERLEAYVEAHRGLEGQR